MQENQPKIGTNEEGQWDPILLDLAKCDGFITITYKDETSEHDPKGFWEPGVECYMRTYSCRIPKAMMGDDVAIDKYIDEHTHEEGFWLDPIDGLFPLR